MTCPSRHHQTETDRLILRAPNDADVESLLAVYGDPATQQFNPMGAMTSRDAASHMLWRWQLHWLQHGFGIWVVCSRETPEDVLGFGGLAWRHGATGRRLMLHIHLRADVAGKGIATEIGAAALVAASQLGAEQTLCASVAPEHAAAIAVLRKLGFAYVGDDKSLPWLPSKALYLAQGLVMQPTQETTYSVSASGRQLPPNQKQNTVRASLVKSR
jgi:RimJ/RimL family protein N-acetyltransferase